MQNTRSILSITYGYGHVLLLCISLNVCAGSQFNCCLNSSDSFDEFLSEGSSVTYISLVSPTVVCGAP